MSNAPDAAREQQLLNTPPHSGQEGTSVSALYVYAVMRAALYVYTCHNHGSEGMGIDGPHARGCTCTSRAGGGPGCGTRGREFGAVATPDAANRNAEVPSMYVYVYAVCCTLMLIQILMLILSR